MKASKLEKMIIREYRVITNPRSNKLQIAVASERLAQFVKMRSPATVERMERDKGLWRPAA